MFSKVALLVSLMCLYYVNSLETDDKIDVIDLTYPANWLYMSEYYSAMDKQWKICVNCGSPGLGTTMHLEHSSSVGSMHPALIPSEYLVARLAIIDMTTYTAEIRPDFVVSLEAALQWPVLRRDAREPTLLLFKFGWKSDGPVYRRSCVCKIPGISYELAEWIASNLTHVVGVATDAPSLESEETREFSTRTVSNLLGKNGIYMIENVFLRANIPEQGCMVLAMPLKLLSKTNVPCRLTAFCSSTKTTMNVVLSLRDSVAKDFRNSRVYDVNMAELLN